MITTSTLPPRIELRVLRSGTNRARRVINGRVKQAKNLREAPSQLLRCAIKSSRGNDVAQTLRLYDAASDVYGPLIAQEERINARKLPRLKAKCAEYASRIDFLKQQIVSKFLETHPLGKILKAINLEKPVRFVAKCV